MREKKEEIMKLLLSGLDSAKEKAEISKEFAHSIEMLVFHALDVMYDEGRKSLAADFQKLLTAGKYY